MKGPRGQQQQLLLLIRAMKQTMFRFTFTRANDWQLAFQLRVSSLLSRQHELTNANCTKYYETRNHRVLSLLIIMIRSMSLANLRTQTL